MSEENELPVGWAETTLGEVRIDCARSIEPNKFPEQNFELYSVPSFETGMPEIVLGSTIGSNKQTVETGAVLLCKINPRINRVWVVGDYSDYQKIASTEWIPFFRLAGIVPEYLCYYMHLHTFKDYLANNVSGVGGSLMRISESTIKEYPFYLAPLNEQQRIVESIEEQFSLLDDSTTSLQKDLIRLKRAREAVLKFAVEGKITDEWREENPVTETGSELLARILAERRARWEAEELTKMSAKGIVPKDEKWKEKYKEPIAPDTKNLPELPEGWCWATVEQIAAAEPNAITDGPFGSNLKTEHYTTEGARVIRLQNIGDGEFKDEKAFISWEHFHTLKKHSIFAGDLVIATLGDKPHRSCIIPEYVGPAIVKADCIRCKVSPDMLNKFVNIALIAEPTRKRTASQTQTHGVGRPRLNLTEIKSVVIPIPPRAEQDILMGEVEMQLSIIAHTEASIEANLKRIEVTRQLILEQAFAGELAEQDPDDEPASVLLERIRAERKQREQEEQQRRKEERMNGANNSRKKRAIKKGRQPLQQVLIEAEQPLTPDALFYQAGFKADVANNITGSDIADNIADFFEELRDEVVNKKRIKVDRPDNTLVLLEAVNNENQ